MLELKKRLFERLLLVSHIIFKFQETKKILAISKPKPIYADLIAFDNFKCSHNKTLMTDNKGSEHHILPCQIYLLPLYIHSLGYRSTMIKLYF